MQSKICDLMRGKNKSYGESGDVWRTAYFVTRGESLDLCVIRVGDDEAMLVNDSCPGLAKLGSGEADGLTASNLDCGSPPPPEPPLPDILTSALRAIAISHELSSSLRLTPDSSQILFRSNSDKSDCPGFGQHYLLTFAQTADSNHQPHLSSTTHM